MVPVVCKRAEAEQLFRSFERKYLHGHFPYCLCVIICIAHVNRDRNLSEYNLKYHIAQKVISKSDLRSFFSQVFLRK